MSDAPSYVICLNCESPCYEFEWQDGKVSEALCTVCGNDDAEQFVTDEEMDSMSGPTDSDS